jgi:hypothetical protein
MPTQHRLKVGFTQDSEYRGGTPGGGHGTFIQQTGDTYVGQWKDDMHDGFGIADAKSEGVYYEGEWSQGMHHGKGIYRWKSGSVYEGEFNMNEKHGYGTYTQANGNCYVGQWVNGKRHGKGKLMQLSYRVAPRTYVSGLQYGGLTSGKELNSMVGATTVGRHPAGVAPVGSLQSTNWDGRNTGGLVPGLAVSEVYDGEWEDDRRCGKGMLIYSNGEVEVCSFQGEADALGREGTRVGPGVRWDPYGENAWRLLDGKLAGKMELAEAAEWVHNFGLPMPTFQPKPEPKDSRRRG